MDKLKNKYTLVHINQCDSTNDIAWDWLNSTKKGQYVIVSDSQTSGRGRRNNKWFSNRESLTFSIALRDVPSNKLSIISLLSGVVVADAINASCNVVSQLKWPNDIMARKNKIGGILIESKISSESINSVIGIGLNINQSENQIPFELRKTASSLKIISGDIVNKKMLLNTIIDDFFNVIENDNKDIIKKWESLCCHIDKQVKFHENKKINEGKVLGINKTGSAKILIDNKIETINSEVIHI